MALTPERSDPMPMSQHDLDRCTEKLRMSNAGCSSCGAAKTEVSKDLLVAKVHGDTREQVMVQMVCPTCGYVKLYLAATLGVPT